MTLERSFVNSTLLISLSNLQFRRTWIVLKENLNSTDNSFMLRVPATSLEGPTTHILFDRGYLIIFVFADYNLTSISYFIAQPTHLNLETLQRCQVLK